MLKLPKNNFIFLETNKFDKDNQCSFLFVNPIKVISCHEARDIEQCFSEIGCFILKGYYAAGFIAYEAGYFFEDALKGCVPNTSAFPLLWFGIYKDPLILRHREKIDILKSASMVYSAENIRPSITMQRYTNDIKRIKNLIRKGDTYQVNYTFKYNFDFKGSVEGFYEDLKAKQGVAYSAIIKTDEFSILSLSPELFFRKHKDMLEVRPMKGTINRGKNLAEDSYQIAVLKNCIKNRSENVMIVDLLRNDLGRISKSGTVKVLKLFEVEKYETLLQMISIVRARIKKHIGIYDLLKAIFPSGSVTGAPKISTMKIINSLEKEPRRIYTGGIGFFTLDSDAIFNVAIRTVLIDNKTGRSEMGVGSGIVYDSEPKKEYDECALKADFISKKKEDFALIETMLWKSGKGYVFLWPHLDRLFSSAEYFNFIYDKKYIITSLKKAGSEFKQGIDFRVRLLLDKFGSMEITSSAVKAGDGRFKVRFSDKKTSHEDIFLYHKTTNRALYDDEYKRWSGKGYFDIIFTNERNEVTEGAISNIIIRRRGIYYTPPLKCGLLDGIYRRYMRKNKKFQVRERVLYKKDIKNADEIYMVNSVRGMTKVML